MAAFEKQVRGDYHAVMAQVDAAARELGSSVTLADECLCRYGDVTVATRVYEKYFMRTESYASLTVTVVSQGDLATIMAIGAGGGSGIFNISWGANASLIKDFEAYLRV
jgi:hypothetical protein